MLLETVVLGLTQTKDATLLVLWVDWLVSMLPWLRPFMRVLVRGPAMHACAPPLQTGGTGARTQG